MTQATVVLADFAEADANGKVHILGAGWSVTGPDPSPQAVVVFLKVPASQTGAPVAVALRLLDPSRNVVVIPGMSGPQPLEISGQVIAKVPTEDWDTTRDLGASFVVNIAPLTLAAGSVYSWVCEVDGKEVASAEFLVRPG
jgi:hypothetical protein